MTAILSLRGKIPIRMITAFGALDCISAHNGLQALSHICGERVDAFGRNSVADIVRAGQQHDHFRIDAVQFAVFETPEDVLDAIGAPTEIGRIPAEEVLASSSRASAG